MSTLWSSEVNKAILEQSKVAEQDYDYILQIFKKQKLSTQNWFQTQFTIKFSHENLFGIICIYLLLASFVWYNL